MDNTHLAEKLSAAIENVKHLHDCMEQVKKDVRENQAEMQRMSKEYAADRARNTLIFAALVFLLNLMTAVGLRALWH